MSYKLREIHEATWPNFGWAYKEQKMTITTNEFGQKNLFAKEPKMYIDPNKDFSVTHSEKAEKLNGRLAMIGVMAALLNYASTGQLIPGIW